MFLSKIRAGSDDRSPWGDFWFTPVASRTSSGQRVSPERAMTLPVVFACIRVRSESFAILPPRVSRKVGGKKQLLDKHWLYDLLRRPNAYQTGFEWRQMMQGHLDLRGNAYNEIQTDRRGNVIGLMPLHPDRVKPEFVGTDGDYRYRYTDRFGKETVFVRGEIWHMRGLSSDGISGMSPIDLARESVGLGLAAQEYGARFFQNDAKPGGGWIEFPGNFKDKPAREQFRESFQEAQTGLNRGKIAVLEYGMKFHELGLTNKESQFLEARQFQIGDIARMYRVPPHKVGDLSKATFSNIEQQSLEFVIDCMTPISVGWESSIESNLLLESEADICIEFDFTALLRGDQAARALFYQSGILNGWMTRNEARESEGEEPLLGLDKPLMPLNMVAIDENGEAETPPPVAEPPPSTDPSARLAAMVRGNAARMAKRIAAGKMPTADVLADALAITLETARAWSPVATAEDDIAAELIALGGEVPDSQLAMAKGLTAIASAHNLAGGTQQKLA